MGLSINDVVSAGGEGGSPKDGLLNRPYSIKKKMTRWKGSKIFNFERTWFMDDPLADKNED